MKKQSFAVMLAAALSVGSLFPAALTVQAETDDNYEFLPRVYDAADLLTDEEESQLLDRLDSLSEEYDFDVAVATVQSTDGVAMNKFTDTFYDDNYYGQVMITTASSLWSALATGNGTLPLTAMA